MAPAATSGAVMRPENCPPPRMSTHCPYLATWVMSACPGRGTSLNRLYLSLSRSSFRMNMVSGVPDALPSLTPETISTMSASLRGVPMPSDGRRRSTSLCTASMSTASPGGTPSRTQPTASPWDEPNRVTLNVWPMVFITSPPCCARGRPCPARSWDRIS